MDFLKKERQELLEFKVNDDKKTQELLVCARSAAPWGGGDRAPGGDTCRRRTIRAVGGVSACGL